MKRIIVLLNILVFCFISAETVKNTNLKKTEKSLEIQKTQVPGYFRFMLGNYEITSIYDGYVDINLAIYIGESNKKKEEYLKNEFAYLTTNNGNSTSKIAVNNFLVNTKKELILIDTGGGNLLGPTMGLNKKNIILSGYKPEDVDKILITHLHPDHAYGLTIDGKMIYPNATIYVNKIESEYWLSKENYTKELQDNLEPYIKNKQYKTFEAGEEITAGVKGLLYNGHTPGHAGYEVTSNNNKIIFWGDVSHGYEIQFSNPDITTEYDYNQDQARETRKTVMKKISKEKILVGGSHLPFPGIGHVAENGSGYRWIPLQYITVE